MTVVGCQNLPLGVFKSSKAHLCRWLEWPWSHRRCSWGTDQDVEWGWDARCGSTGFCTLLTLLLDTTHVFPYRTQKANSSVLGPPPTKMLERKQFQIQVPNGGYGHTFWRMHMNCVHILYIKWGLSGFKVLIVCMYIYESWAKGPWKGFPLRKPLGMQLTVSAKVFFLKWRKIFFSG